MLPTFVIGLREGLEAALIVGIIATFLNRRDRRDMLRPVWIGVSIAVAICLAIGLTLYYVDQAIKQQAQERLETVIGVLAVITVTAMIVWMRKNARNLKGELESAAESALAQGSARALVMMAFLAVLREGFETAVFLLATFDGGSSPGYGALGAALGIIVAALLGYGVYRGGVRLNLAKFFQITGFVLVLVAAGLVMTAFRTAYEGGWLHFGQGTPIDLTWLVRPGTVVESLVTGMLGWRAHPATIELIAWVCYAVPMLIYVGWPARRRQPKTAEQREPAHSAS